MTTKKSKAAQLLAQAAGLYLAAVLEELAQQERQSEVMALNEAVSAGGGDAGAVIVLQFGQGEPFSVDLGIRREAKIWSVDRGHLEPGDVDVLH